MNLETRRVSFCAGRVEAPDGLVLAATKTRRRHVVDLDPSAFELLAERAAADGASPQSDAFVFSDDNGLTAWKPNRLRKRFSDIAAPLGLRSFRLHDLRHFMATEMLNAGVPIVVISRRLDHRRVSATLDKYAHVVPGEDGLGRSVADHAICLAKLNTRTEPGNVGMVERAVGN